MVGARRVLAPRSSGLQGSLRNSAQPHRNWCMIIEIQMVGLSGSLAEANLKGQEFIGHQREVIVGQFAQPLKIQRDAIRELKSGFFS